MSSTKDGMMLILSSPSGAGKTTLVKKISIENNFQISVSHTTRSPRTNEIEGKDYFFITKEKFEILIKKNEFIEYAKVFGNYYGSSKQTVIKNLDNGKNVIFDIDWQGTEQIKKINLNYKLVTFFILPPSRDVLFQRLTNRDMKDKNIVEQRMKQFDQDILHWKNYDFVVINDDLEKCFNEIINLWKSSIKNNSGLYDKQLIENHIHNLLR